MQIVREEFGKGNAFCEKITYKTGTARIVTKEIGPDGKEVEKITYKSTGVKPEDLLSSFRNSYDPRIVVTVDMIATGTDIKPLEIVMFMRSVKSRNYFEQMKGRGVRVIDPTDFQAVTPDARSKTHFVIVDCVGLCEQEMTDSRPLERKPKVAFEKLLQAVAFGSTDPDVLSSLASRLARLERQLGARRSTGPRRDRPRPDARGRSPPASWRPSTPTGTSRPPARRRACPPDAQPTPEQIAQAAEALRQQAAAPLAGNTALRKQLPRREAAVRADDRHREQGRGP